MALERTTAQKSGIFSNRITDLSDMGHVFQSANIYNRADIEWYTKFNRFGVLDPFNALTNTKEYLFFTKPDLHIYTPNTNTLNPQLADSPFFVELDKRYPEVIGQLQKSAYSNSSFRYPFINILSNSVKNTMDLQEIQAEDIDTPATIYGTQIQYRGDGFSSDEGLEVTLEFEDTRFLELYHFFKAYEEYERLKRIGKVSPPNINGAPDLNGYNYNSYIENKELHDQFGVYKFIVDEDYETIVYYAYGIGVYPKNVPREAFSDMKVDGGLRYQVPFKVQFVDDMKPYILGHFNELISDSMGNPELSRATFIDIYNDTTKSIDGRWALTPWVVKRNKPANDPGGTWLGPQSMQYEYKLKWRIK